MAKEFIDRPALPCSGGDSAALLSFLGDSLASIGLRVSNSERGTGVLFRGDDVTTSGFYFGWAHGNDYIVTVCDFTLLCDATFMMDAASYLAIRKDLTGRNRVMAFAEPVIGLASAGLRSGMRCAYVEVLYLRSYLQSRLASLGDDAVGGLSGIIAEMDHGMIWPPAITQSLDIVSESKARGPAADLIFEGAANTILGALVDIGQSALPAGKENRRAMLSAIAFINEHFCEDIHQSDVAAHTYLGTTKFKRLFKETFGTTMSDYVTSLRIKKAKTLLQRRVPVEEVSQAVGYHAATSFSTMFKKRVGQTPREFRDAMRVYANKSGDDGLEIWYS